MTFSDAYRHQAELVLRVLPLLDKTPDLALKGGTAINLFYQNLPRLSVDIDLCYLPIESRNDSIANINSQLQVLQKLIEERLQLKVQQTYTAKESISKLLVRSSNSEIKIEPNYTLRGSCYPPERRESVSDISNTFEASVECTCLSFDDVYGGKFCAALSRQHPRDLFDVKVLLDTRGLTDRLRKAFIIYLIQSDRPISELLAPNPIDLKLAFTGEFSGMLDQEVTLKELVEVQHSFPIQLRQSLTENEKDFLISFKAGNPIWNKLGIGDFSHLPGVRWKSLNIQKMGKEKSRDALSKLYSLLENISGHYPTSSRHKSS